MISNYGDCRTRAHRLPALGISLLLFACGGGDDSKRLQPQTQAAATASRADSSARSLATADTANNTAGFQIDTTQRDAVELFYRSVYASSNDVAPDWTGNLANCDAGDTSPAYKAAVQRRINWWRAMAGVPANVQLDPTSNRKAQQAALMYAANDSIGHFPTSSVRCWSELGAEAARNSSLGSGPLPAAMDRYVEEPGASNSGVGHRLWLLYPPTQNMGTGDVPWRSAPGNERIANALWVTDDRFFAPRPTLRDGFVAWPAPGFVPHKVVYPRWSFTYADADFANANVTMTENGRPLPVTIDARVVISIGNTLVWLPGAYRDGMHWQRPTADTRYEVTVSNVRVNGQPREFRYAVTVFDADAQPAWAHAPTARSDRIAAGVAATFDTTALARATAYQWRGLELSPLNWSEGAETGGLGVILNTAPDYQAISTDTASEGSRAFHLAHSQHRYGDQTMTIRQRVIPGSAAQLRFASRLAWATTWQSAIVEASTDNGQAWTELWRQDGTNNRGETGFSVRQISLAAFAGKQVMLRFRYALGGNFYPNSGPDFGWWIDAISVTGSETVTDTGATTETTGPIQSLRFPATGRWILQSRVGMYGQWSDWGSNLIVNVSTSQRDVAQCLFNWGQRLYPDLLAAASPTLLSTPYIYRAYAGNVYLGLSTADSHLYLQRNSVLEDLGPVELWVARAGC